MRKTHHESIILMHALNIVSRGRDAGWVKCLIETADAFNTTTLWYTTTTPTAHKSPFFDSRSLCSSSSSSYSPRPPRPPRAPMQRHLPSTDRPLHLWVPHPTLFFSLLFIIYPFKHILGDGYKKSSKTEDLEAILYHPFGWNKIYRDHQSILPLPPLSPNAKGGE